MFGNVVFYYIVRTLLFAAIAVLGIYMGYCVRNRKVRYFIKQRRKDKLLGKTRASIERYYSATQLKIIRRNRKRSWEECYTKCYGILNKISAKERNALKARLNADIKTREMWGIILAVATVLFTYLVESYSQALTAKLLEKMPSLFEVDIMTENEVLRFLLGQDKLSTLENHMTILLGIIFFGALFLFTYSICSRASKDVFVLSIIGDMETGKHIDRE